MLFVDIDGVLNPYQSTCPNGYLEHLLFPDQAPVRVCAQHAGWLSLLAESYDLVWATGWNEHDRVRLAEVLPLPAFSAAIELPAGTFHPNLKIPAVESVAGDRPLAWIDDMFLPEAWTWAADRPQPTLLVSVDPALGLTEEIVDKLQAWVGGVR